METYTKLLQNHTGRDKVLRTVNYTCVYLAALTKGQWKHRFQTLAKELSSCRTVLRLFDDIPMLGYTLMYGCGKQENDTVLRWLGVVNNLLDQLYYPLEHIAWAADLVMIHADGNVWWNRAIAVWASSLYISMMRAIRIIILLEKQKGCSECQSRDLLKHQLQQILLLVQNMLDFCIAVNWLPKGILWSGKLKPWQVGFAGLIASVVGLLRFMKSI